MCPKFDSEFVFCFHKLNRKKFELPNICWHLKCALGAIWDLRRAKPRQRINKLTDARALEPNTNI